jgi:hypothetical protein
MPTAKLSGMLVGIVKKTVEWHQNSSWYIYCWLLSS